jgi:predicted ATPase
MLEARWLPGPPQQSTLYAMLDWSYRLLPEKEKSAFRHLSVFSGRFDLEAASAIVDEDVETASILAELVSRALLSRNQSEFGTRYRLLDTTRRYARDRLTEANEMHEARRRHAMFFMRMLQNLKDGDFDQNLPKMLASEVDDVLAAVTWLFRPAQDSLSCRRALEEATYFEQFMMKSCMG